jgi:hypothetical protein
MSQEIITQKESGDFEMRAIQLIDQDLPWCGWHDQRRE